MGGEIHLAAAAASREQQSILLLGLPSIWVENSTYSKEIAVVMVQDALEVGRVLPGDLLL